MTFLLTNTILGETRELGRFSTRREALEFFLKRKKIPAPPRTSDTDLERWFSYHCVKTNGRIEEISQ
jgi:hypothetical protein